MSSTTQLARLTPMSDDEAVDTVAERPKNLTKKQKAAIIVRFLLNEGADLSLDDLSESQQSELTYLMGDMGYIHRDTLGDVLMEFAHELESIGLSFPNGISGALNALDGRISPLTAARLRKEAGVRQYGDPWRRIKALPIEDLAEMLRSESIEVSAVLISKLDVDKAAKLLALVPGDKARRITYAVSMTGGITPEAVDRIGLSLACQMDDAPAKAFVANPADRIGAILNSSTEQNRDQLLDSLEENDSELAGQVRKTIFTYKDIPMRVEPRDVPQIIREIDNNILVAAFAHAKDGERGDASEFLLENMSSRLADQVREGIDERGRVSNRDGEAALTEVTVMIRSLVADEAIVLIPLAGEKEE